jgi:hypothetical protein
VDYRARIVRDPRICGGEPVIRGTRVTLSTVLASLAEGNSIGSILRANLKRLNTLRTADYNTEVASTLNRLQRLLGSNVLRATFGQPDISLDLGTALEQGHIILVRM